MKPKKSDEIMRRSVKVQGWFSPEAARLISMFDEFQQQHGIEGNIFEIGVHHGKSSIFFSHLLRPAENLHICDLFGEAGNVSRSGSGDEEVFRTNMQRFGLKPAAAYHKCLSSNLTSDLVGINYRIFHVDGGHNPDEAFGDMVLAASVLNEQGLIIVDDPFRVEWPGVTEAIVKFLEKYPDFEPVAVGFNKFVIARRTVAADYKKFIAEPGHRKEYRLDFPWEFKELPFAGANLFIFFIPTRYTTLNSSRIWLAKIRRSLTDTN